MSKANDSANPRMDNKLTVGPQKATSSAETVYADPEAAPLSVGLGKGAHASPAASAFYPVMPGYDVCESFAEAKMLF